MQPLSCYNYVMSVLTPVGIIVFSMLIAAFLQLVPGIFLIFSHFVTGKYSKNKASDLTAFFIFGVETATITMFLATYAILCSASSIIDSTAFAWIAAGIFIALSLITLTLYFRKGRGSRLFISRSFAKSIRTKVTTVKSRSDAFFLGFFSIVPELFFTLPIYFACSVAIMQLAPTSFGRAGLIVLFALTSIAPLLILHAFSRTHTTADFIRFRFQNKSFFRFALSLFYLFLAILIILGVLL